MTKCTVILCGILIILIKCSAALEYNKQRIQTNTDFLMHEGGLQSSAPKRDYVASNSYSQATNSNQNGGKRDYVAQFPALGPPVTPKSTSTTALNNINSGPQHNEQNLSNGKRDYVAPVTPKPSTTSSTTIFSSGQQRNPQSPNGKRDYVAPQFPTLKPVQPTQHNQPAQNNQPTGGKVKDLINFYDNKGPNQGPPSYSSILQGTTNKNGPTSTTRLTQPMPTVAPSYPTKPMSFSSVVSGGNKPGVTGVQTTAKPTTRIPTTPGSPGSRPGSSVLPSSIVNNNRGTTANNNGNVVTDGELQTLSEELLRKDSNNAARYVTINYQGKTTSQSKDDMAPLPLLTVSPEAWNIPTIQKFVALLDNYERDTLVNEHVTPQERIEENAFMDAVMSTTVMRHLMTFLKNKGYVTPDPKQQRDFVKQLWFTLYSRGKGKLGSSGFEHTFVSELKNGAVSGLHNWIYFSREEAANRANYLGYLKYHQLNDKGAVLKLHFSQQGVDKPVGGMFIGTSPELEMALYTLCFVTRVDNDCKLKLANNEVNILTYNYRYRSKNLVGSAFPQI